MAAPRGRTVNVAVAGLVVAGLLAGCAGSGQRYVKNSSEGVYFTIPDDWKLYEEDAILDFQDDQLGPEAIESRRDGSWQVFFDAAPRPSLRHLEQFLTAHPNGQAQVLELGPQQRDTVSLEVLRNLVLPIDEISQIDETLVELVDAEEINRDGVRGVQFVFNVDMEAVDSLIAGLEPAPDRKPEFATINQTALVDSATRKLYALVISCEAGCYEDNKSTIEKVADSWTVEET
jgi:hypothetical protein